MSKQMDILKESISKPRIRYNKNIDCYTSIFESILDRLYENHIASYHDSINSIIVKENNAFWEISDTMSSIDQCKSDIHLIIEDTCNIFNELEYKLKFILHDQIIPIKKVIQNNYNSIESNNKDIYFSDIVYNYTNLGTLPVDINVIHQINEMNRYIYTCILDDEQCDDFILLSDKETINNFLIFYRDRGEKINKTVYTSYDIMNACNSITDYIAALSNINKDMQFFLDSIKSIESLFNFDKFISDMVKHEMFLDKTKDSFSKLMKNYVYAFTAEIDALSEAVQSNSSLIFEAINQITNKPIYIYDSPDNTVEDINTKMDIQKDLADIEEAIIYNESVITLEAAGLIVVNEETVEKFNFYFKKITQQMVSVIQKIHAIINKKIAERITPMIKNLKNQNKPEPTFEIKNYKIFEFDKLKSEIKPEPFNYTTMQDNLVNKDTFMQKYYPDLKDPQNDENKNIYKILLKLYVKEDQNEKCTSEMIDDFTDFLSKDYANYIDDLEDFSKEIEKAQNQIIPLARQFNTNTDKDTTVQTNTQTTTQTATVKPNQTNESVNILEAETDKKDDNKTTTFEDDPNAPKVDAGKGNTKLMRDCTLYCSIMSQLLSARIKFVNFAYNDRLKIVMHYAIKNKFNKTIEKKKEENNNENEEES